MTFPPPIPPGAIQLSETTPAAQRRFFIVVYRTPSIVELLSQTYADESTARAEAQDCLELFKGIAGVHLVAVTVPLRGERIVPPAPARGPADLLTEAGL